MVVAGAVVVMVAVVVAVVVVAVPVVPVLPVVPDVATPRQRRAVCFLNIINIIYNIILTNCLWYASCGMPALGPTIGPSPQGFVMSRKTGEAKHPNDHSTSLCAAVEFHITHWLP